jgi:hypothetical protein
MDNHIDEIALAVAETWSGSLEIDDLSERRFRQVEDLLKCGVASNWCYEYLLDHQIELEPEVLRVVERLVVAAMLRQHRFDMGGQQESAPQPGRPGRDWEELCRAGNALAEDRGDLHAILKTAAFYFQLPRTPAAEAAHVFLEALQGALEDEALLAAALPEAAQ